MWVKVFSPIVVVIEELTIDGFVKSPKGCHSCGSRSPEGFESLDFCSHGNSEKGEFDAFYEVIAVDIERFAWIS